VSDDGHEGPGHGDVFLSLTTPLPGGGYFYRTWPLCECSALLRKLGGLLGPPEAETVADAAAASHIADLVRDVPGTVHLLGEGR
jgi:hypothetical protein